MAVKRGLGKGLDSLIPPTNMSAINKTTVKEEKKEDVKSDVTVKLKTSEIEPNKKQPRKLFNEDALQELADSISQVGIISPIIVVKKEGYYQIIAGERRWRAAKIAGLKEVPVVVAEYTEKEIAEIALIENIQREDLNPIEEAMGYKQLIEEFSLKQDEVAERVGKSRTAITNTMRLLDLCDEVKSMLIEQMISAGHARALLAVKDNEQQYIIAQEIFDKKLSVRETEKLIKELGKPKKEKTAVDEQLQVIYESFADKLKSTLGTKVSIAPKANGSGKLEIEFYSSDDFDRIVEKLLES
ncbi:MAG: ParB/RepB/Spo0J family partition protein [Lachnospiraceae bacterium]